MTKKPSKVPGWVGLCACYVLAILSLAGGISRVQQLMPIVTGGKTVPGQVVAVNVGVKGLKTAVLQFTTDTGEEITVEDLLPMMIFRYRSGDRVTIIYHPTDAGVATIDVGIWIWFQPGFFFFCFVLLSVLGIVLFRSRTRKIGTDHD